MKSPERILTRPSVRIPKFVFLLTATMAVGCVDLSKPVKVERCAAVHNCSDNPSQQPGPDATDATEQPGPDLSYQDKPTAKEDLGPDSPIPDAPADQADHGPATPDVTATDGKDTDDSPGADGDSPPADSGPELGPDTIRQDVGPDLGPDLGSDLRPDLGPDLGPDLRPDLRPDLGPDLGPDLRPDVGPDVSPDTSTLGSGLLIYYKCESATGTTLPDSSGNGNNGTLAPGTAGYSFSAGKVGNALTLAKAGSGYVSMPAAVFANLTNITVATWVNVTTSSNWQRVLDVGKNANLANNTSTGTLYMNLVPQTDATKLAFAISKDGYGSEQVLTSTALSTGTWKHVAVVLASGQETLYVDGVSAASSTTVALRPTDLATIDYAFLGKSQFTADPYFDGKIDEFRVYGRALSATEIQALYQFAGP
jgi:hypothetical protein